ncbi:MAG: hypothetical protein CBB68_02550 [Rhodospirillaceae bacterium TMED8]|nr:NADPH nitroreductase [Magnetovibrio sp.]OUT52254.1 MAG: hypothetical protein CBB68_02550 [Rhodospirillaceae bacterium TMED8]|tara:strand:- start:15581 stop:16459 length:879 start_codon:yes stop_codon:yes gene_type:complete
MTNQRPKTLGFIGLGQMGSHMAANILKGGGDLIVYDKAGSKERAPEGAKISGNTSALAEATDTIFISVPDGHASLSVINEIVAHRERRAKVIIDLSTIGPAAARQANAICKKADITYIDAPVSGGQAGAKAGTITIMAAGERATKETHDEIFFSFSRNLFYVGEEPGQGQALKILNNFLSGTAMAATTEAILYGISQGLEMGTMLDVINVSTGQNTATTDKFPTRILTETFNTGFATALLAKDIKLFFDNAQIAGTPIEVAEVISTRWAKTDQALPNSDITLHYKLMRDGKL